MNTIIGWLVKLFENKAQLYDGTPTEGKPWYKSKTILSNIIVMAIGVYYGTSQLMVMNGKPALPEIPNAILTILGGLGIYGRLDASKPVTLVGTANPATPK